MYNNLKINYIALKPEPKRIADSTAKNQTDANDNKNTPGNTPSLKPAKKK